MDTYISMNLRLHSVINPEDLQILMKEESVVKAYQSALKRLVIKDRTRKEMVD